MLAQRGRGHWNDVIWASVLPYLRLGASLYRGTSLQRICSLNMGSVEGVGPLKPDAAQLEEALTRFEYEIGDGSHRVIALSDMYGAWGAGLGGSVWASGPALLGWLSHTSERRAMVEGRSCLELGAGLGLTGIGLIKAFGARKVHLTDLPKQLPLLRRNVAANHESGDPQTPSVSALVWGTVPAVVGDETWDVLVGTDLTYDDEHVEPLAATIHGLLSRRPLTRGLFALPLRCEFEPRYCRAGTGEVLPDLMMLVDLLVERGWHCEQIGSISSEEAGTAENAIAVWTVHAAAQEPEVHEKKKARGA